MGHTMGNPGNKPLAYCWSYIHVKQDSLILPYTIVISEAMAYSE